MPTTLQGFRLLGAESEFFGACPTGSDFSPVAQSPTRSGSGQRGTSRRGRSLAWLSIVAEQLSLLWSSEARVLGTSTDPLVSENHAPHAHRALHTHHSTQRTQSTSEKHDDKTIARCLITVCVCVRGFSTTTIFVRNCWSWQI